MWSWRSVAQAVLRHCSGLGLAASTFLMDLSSFKMDNFPGYYPRVLRYGDCLSRKDGPTVSRTTIGAENACG